MFFQNLVKSFSASLLAIVLFLPTTVFANGSAIESLLDSLKNQELSEMNYDGKGSDRVLLVMNGRPYSFSRSVIELGEICYLTKGTSVDDATYTDVGCDGVADKMEVDPVSSGSHEVTGEIMSRTYTANLKNLAEFLNVVSNNNGAIFQVNGNFDEYEKLALKNQSLLVVTVRVLRKYALTVGKDGSEREFYAILNKNPKIGILIERKNIKRFVCLVTANSMVFSDEGCNGSAESMLDQSESFRTASLVVAKEYNKALREVFWYVAAAARGYPGKE